MVIVCDDGDGDGDCVSVRRMMSDEGDCNERGVMSDDV